MNTAMAPAGATAAASVSATHVALAPSITSTSVGGTPVAQTSVASPQLSSEDDLLPLKISCASVCDAFRKEFPDLSIVERGYQGSVDGRTLHGPAIGITHPNLRGALIAGYGQRNFSDSPFVIVPPLHENLFVEGGRLYTGSAIRLAWSGETLEIGCETYSTPLELGMLLCFGSHQVDKDILITSGISVLNSPPVIQFLGDKARFKEAAVAYGIATPRFKNIAAREALTKEDAVALLDAFLAENGAKGFVLKPLNKSGGAGVRLFKAHEVDEAAEYLVASLKLYDTMLLEERIDSKPYYIEGTRIDWNLRVMVADIADDWDIHASSEVRAAEYNGSPVNKCTGAKISEVAEAFDRLGLTRDERLKLEREIRRISESIKDAIYRALLAGHGGVDTIDSRGRSYFNPLFLGLDLIVDEKLNVHCIEVNAGYVGGIESLAEIRSGDGKYRSIQELARSAHALMGVERRAAEDESVRKAPDRRSIVSDYAFAELAGIFHERKMYDRAIAYYLKALERNPEESALWNDLGSVYNEQGGFDRAIECYEKATELDPKDATIWNNLGNAYWNRSDFDKAIECYEKAVELDPTYAVAWRNLGTAYGIKGNIDKAIVCNKKATEVNPKDARAWYYLGNAYWNTGELNKAIECFEEVIELDPTDTIVWSRLGAVYVAKGDVGKALECIKEANARDPKD